MADRNPNQPSGVTTEERPRPPDESVVTSDIDLSAGAESPSKPAEPEDRDKPPAAATDDNKSERPKGQDSATDDDNKDDPPPKRRNQPAEYRIKKMTRKLADSERSREALERKLAEQEQRLADLEQKARDGRNDDDPPPEPKLEDFEDPRKYAKAYAKWERDTEQAKRPSAPSRRTPPRDDPPPPREPRPDVDREISEFQSRGQEQYGDEFLEALQARIPVNQDMGEFMLDSKHGPALYIHLANNPEEAAKIHDSSPRRAAKLLEELDARAAKGELDVPDGELKVQGDDDNDKGEDKKTSTTKSNTDDKAAPRRGRQQTRAPEPPDQNKDRGRPVTDTDLEALDMEDYAATRREQLKKQRF